MTKAVESWLDIAQEDFENGEVLLQNKRYSGALLFFQQSVEKALKAHCFIKSGDIPPKSHDLAVLLDNTDLPQASIDMNFLKKLSLSYIRLRYPDLDRTYYSDKEKILELIEFAKSLYLWIKDQFNTN